MLGSAEIAVMAASGLIDFGAHTRSHAILSTLPSEHCRQEIEHSVATVTRLTGRPCTLLAYPNGAYNEAVIGLARACGVTAAVTTNRHSNHAAISPMELGRYDIGRDMTMARFVATVHHLSRARPRWRSRRPHSTVDSGEQHDASRHRSLPLRDTGT
jgi:peptidoglycan/xylan/chitin deacetylase (PgdA/CDA1 family)